MNDVEGSESHEVLEDFEMTESCISEFLARLIGLGISAVRSEFPVTFFCHI